MTSDDNADDLVTLEFLKGVAQRLPDDADVLRAIGDLYTRVGQYERGLETDRKLVQLCPEDSMVWYNLGCGMLRPGAREPARCGLRSPGDSRATGLPRSPVDGAGRGFAVPAERSAVPGTPEEDRCAALGALRWSTHERLGKYPFR